MQATLPKQTLIKSAREWCAECAECGCYRDVDADWVLNAATDAEIMANIARDYEGGIAAFERENF